MLSYFQEKIKNKQTIISFIIVIIILTFLILNANINELIEHISQINPIYFILAIIIFYLSIFPRALRYNILLKNIGINQRLKNITEIYFLSWFANLIAPAKLGDLYRSYLIKKNYGNSKSETLGATFVERLMDLILLIILISIAGFLIIEEAVSGQIKNFLIAAYIILIILLILIFVLKGFREKLTKLLPEKFRHVIPNFEKSMSTCLTKKTIFQIILLTIVYWILEIGTLYFVALALNTNLSLMLIIFVTLISALTSVIPLTPSGAGAAEAGVTATLVLFGIPYSLAFAIAIVHRSIDYYSGLVTGTIVYIKSKLK